LSFISQSYLLSHAHQTPSEAGSLFCDLCGETYFLHRVRQQSSSQVSMRVPAPVSSTSVPTVPMWMRPGAFSEASRAVNQDRMQAAQRHRSPPMQMPPHTRLGGISANPLVPFPTVQISSSSSAVAVVPASRRPRQRQHRQQPGPSSFLARSASVEVNFLIVIHPEPVSAIPLC
jgi:hypothetical protein